MGNVSYMSTIGDKLTDVILWTIFNLFEIYNAIATLVLRIFFPITKYVVDKRLASWNVIVGKDIIVLNESRFYTRTVIEGSFGMMEGLMDKDWKTNDFKGFVEKVLGSRRRKEVLHPLTWVYKTFNLQTKGRAFEVGKHHYDAGNDIIESMLDKNLQYTCGYWKNSDNLDDAQIAKMNLIARKLMLKPGMRVLDVGCGYGTLGHYLATNFKVSVVGVTISEEQVKYANNLCKGLDCEFRLCDYRDLDEEFDRIVSVGMFEHTGHKNYKTFFQVIRKCLKDDGIFLLHTIGNLHKSFIGGDPWTDKYIFRNGYIPYYVELCKAIEDLWIIEDWHNFGFDYSKTLAAWEQNFDKNWHKFEKLYGERFHTMWKMYLETAQGCFSTRSLHLWQIVLSKDGLKGGYHAPR